MGVIKDSTNAFNCNIKVVTVVVSVYMLVSMIFFTEQRK